MCTVIHIVYELYLNRIPRHLLPRAGFFKDLRPLDETADAEYKFTYTRLGPPFDDEKWRTPIKDFSSFHVNGLPMISLRPLLINSQFIHYF